MDGGNTLANARIAECERRLDEIERVLIRSGGFYDFRPSPGSVERALRSLGEAIAEETARRKEHASIATEAEPAR